MDKPTFDMAELGVAADFLEERGMFPTAVAALRQELRFAQAVAEVLPEWFRGECVRCDGAWPDHDADCGVKYLRDIACTGQGKATKVWLVTRGDGSDGNEWYVKSIHSTRHAADVAATAKPGDLLGDSNVEEWTCE